MLLSNFVDERLGVQLEKKAKVKAKAKRYTELIVLNLIYAEALLQVANLKQMPNKQPHRQY